MNKLNLRQSLAILSIFLLYGCTIESNQPNPNIVLILIDDMGWKDVGYAGSTFYDTPNIDQLAAQGMVFTNAYSPAPVCTPSRGGIFSGKYPGRTKLTTVFNGPAGPDDRLHDKSKYRGKKDQYFEARNRHALPKSEKIIAQAMADGGYRTGFFGKWHIGECPGYYPDDRGFQVAKGYRRVHGKKYGHFGDRWPVGNFANLPDPDSTAFIPEILTNECIDFMRENKDEPFFAVLSHYIVHTPITPKKEKVPKYDKRLKNDQASSEYAALVESVDESVGQVLLAIKEMGLEDNTVIIFTSDNGGLVAPHITSNYPLMGGKSFPFEAGTKVPLIVKWPKKIAPGKTNVRAVGTDLYPTILSAAGFSLMPQQHTDGVNLMPLLQNKEDIPPRPIVFHFPHYTHATGPYSSIIENNWKLIRFYNDEEGAYLLYNLDKDPEEQHNLSETDLKRREELAGRLSYLLKEMDAEMPTKNPDFNFDPDKRYYNLKHTKNLAEKERQMFEERLGIIRNEIE